MILNLFWLMNELTLLHKQPCDNSGIHLWDFIYKNYSSIKTLSKIFNFREQLEDAETAKLSALKGRHTLESELNDLRMEVSYFK